MTTPKHYLVNTPEYSHNQCGFCQGLKCVVDARGGTPPYPTIACPICFAQGTIKYSIIDEATFNLQTNQG